MKNCYDCLFLKVKIPILDRGYLDYDDLNATCSLGYILDRNGFPKHFKNPLRYNARYNKAFRQAAECEAFSSMNDEIGESYESVAHRVA